MRRLLENKWECTDPDNLQFCVKLDDYSYWYCQLIELTGELKKFAGYPGMLIAEGKELILNESYWAHGEIHIDDIEYGEVTSLVESYGYDITQHSSFENVQMVIEMYFETNINDFVNN